MILSKLFALVVILTNTSVLAGADRPQALEVVPSVDLFRYAGKWYEIMKGKQLPESP